uniref:C-type lectin domain-containing protein n=1 Tax=Labrus bergylta TaxID=56723 RepID=A0A3Q3E0G8_9LABR
MSFIFLGLSFGIYSVLHLINGFTLPSRLRFFCFNLMVDEVKKTWEEALEHCRETHTDLTSLNSETEQRLALSEIQHDHITERVWIGLRFFGDRWLWVNGDPLVYEAWPEGDQEHQCPLRKRCGALTKEGHWENWDCEEKVHFICY